MKNFDWHDNQLTLHDANLGSDFSINDRQLKFAKAQGRLLGGSFTGDAEINNWLSPQTNLRGGKDKQKKTDEQKGVLRLRLKDVSAGAVAAAVSTRQYPLDRLNLAGASDGTIETRWTGSLQRAETDFALKLVPPANPQARQLPVSATARGTYRAGSDELELAQLDAATRSSQIHANGKLGGTSSLQILAGTSDLDELRPLIVALHGPNRLPVDVHGSAHFTGTASGKFSAATLAGHLQILDFDSLIPATDRAPEQQVHWDSLAADVQVSPRNVAIRHATGVHGETSAHFDLSASLSKGEFNPTDTFTANLNLENADIAELQALAGYSYPVTGKMNVTMQAGGTRENPHAEGHVQVLDAVAYGEPLEHFDSDLRWSNGEASFNNIQLNYYDAKATGGAAYNPSTRTYHFNVTGTNFDLTRVPKLQSTRVAVGGHADFTAQGSGTPETPTINAKFHVRDLTLDHERTGNLAVDAATEGEAIRVSARSEFEHSQFNLEGTVRPRQDFAADLTVRFDHLDVDSFVREYLKGTVIGHSGISGQVQLRGSLRKPRELTMVANLDDVDLNVDQLQVKNQGPVRLTLAQQVVRLEQLHVVGDNTDFSAHGTASLIGNRDLDLAAEGHLNMQLIQTLNSDFTSSGMVDLSMTMTGPVGDPLLQGRVNVSHGSIAYLDLPSGLSDMNGSLVFNKNRLQIENLTARAEAERSPSPGKLPRTRVRSISTSAQRRRTSACATRRESVPRRMPIFASTARARVQP